MPRREILKNNVSDTLSAAITNSDTTLSVTTGSKFPSTGDFHVLVDAEIMLVTARSSNTLTITRAQEGTSATSHSNGAVITIILTAASLKQYLRDNSPCADGSRPAFRLVDASGDPLISSDFTTVNLSDSTISDQDGSILLRMAASGSATKVTALARTSGSELIAAVLPTMLVTSTVVIPVAFIGFRESSTGKLLTIGYQPKNANLGVTVQKYTNPTTLGTTPFVNQILGSRGPVWLRVTDDSTNLKFYVGDGVEWAQVFSEGRTVHMAGGPDQFVWGSNIGGNGIDTLNRLVAWQEG